MATTTTDKAKKADRQVVLNDINAVRLANKFAGNMGVTVDFDKDEVSIIFISTVGVTKHTLLKAPSMNDFAVAIRDIAKEAHSDAKVIMNERGALPGAYAKAITLKSFREPQGENLQNSNRDVKTAAAIHDSILEAAKLAAAERAAKLAEAKQAIEDAKAVITELEG